MNVIFLLVVLAIDTQYSKKVPDISVAPTSQGFLTYSHSHSFQDGDIYHEDFEIGYLPPGWSIIDGNGDMWSWKVVNIRDFRYLWGFIPPFAGDYMLCYNDNIVGPNSPPTVEGASVTVSLPEGLHSLFLTFSWGLVQYCEREMLFVTVGDETVWDVHSTGRGVKTVDISQYKSDSSLTLCFYYDDGGGCWGWAGAFDNIKLSEEPPLPTPGICCLHGQCGPYFGGLWLADMAYDNVRDLFYQVEVKHNGSDILIWDPKTCDYCVAYDSTTGISQRGIAYNPEEDVIYVGGWNQGIIYTFRAPQCNEELSLVSSCGINNPSLRKIAGLAWDDDNGGLFVQSNTEENTLGKVNPSTCRILWVSDETFYWRGRGYDGAGLSYSRDEHGLYAVSMYDNSVNFFRNPDWDDCVADTFCYLMNPVGFGWGIGHRDGSSGEFWVGKASISSPKDYLGSCINIGITEKSKEKLSSRIEISPTLINDRAEVSFMLPKPGEVVLSVYNSGGRLVDKIIDKYLASGEYTVTWDVSGLLPGVYFVKFRANSITSAKKVVLVK